MCILSDREIIELAESGELISENFSVDSITPNGYDLRVSEISLPGTSNSWKEGVALVPAGKTFFVSSLEPVKLPNNISAQLWTRTTWLRKGIIMGFGKVDAGFNGTLTFTGFNASPAPVEIPIGARFVQIVFETLHSPATLTYEKRSGHYQGQRGITLDPINKD